MRKKTNDPLLRWPPMLWLFVVIALLAGCSEANRAVVVNGVSSSMSVIDFGLPPQITDNYGESSWDPAPTASWSEDRRPT